MRTISHAPAKKSPLAASTSAIHSRPSFPVSGISDSTPLAPINTAPTTKQTTSENGAHGPDSGKPQ